MDVLLLALAALLAATFVLAGGRAVARWRGPRRTVAVVVLLAVVAWVAKIALDVRGDPTSHNLWPLEVAGLVAAALAVLGVLAVVGPRWARASRV